MQKKVLFIRPMFGHCLALSLHNLCMMSPHNLLCSCQCSCWDWTDVTLAIIGAKITWPLLAYVELNCWIYNSCYRDLLKVLHRFVKVVACIFRPLPKCSKRIAKDNSKSPDHQLPEHFRCVDICKYVHPLSTMAVREGWRYQIGWFFWYRHPSLTNIIHCLQTLSSCNIGMLNWWWHLSGFWSR